MICNLDNNTETWILYVPSLFHYRCLQLRATSGNYFPFVRYSWPSYSLLFARCCCVRNVSHEAYE